jgi:hypothetical protein
MKKNKYNTLYFIKKFEAIPEEKWGIGAYDYNGKKCALGHCGASVKLRAFQSKESNTLMSLFFDNFFKSAVHINDEEISLGYHPKERILNALYLINAMDIYGK